MAKLSGVQTTGMENGVITVIEHYGVEYTKVDCDAQSGDIVRSTGAMDADTGNMYSVSRFGRYPTIRDDVGDYRGNLKTFDVYRKLAQPPKVSQPFAEMITSKVDAVEKRVAALESAEQQPPELAYDTRVKALRSGEFGNIGAGEIGRVSKVSKLSNDPYNVRVRAGLQIDYFRPQDLELASKVTLNPTVGDFVVITGNTNYSRNKVGDIGKVVEHVANDGYTVSVEVPGNNHIRIGNHTRPSEMRLATDAEKAEYEKAVEDAKQAELDAVFTKAGRKPNEYRKGDVVLVTTGYGGIKNGEIGVIAMTETDNCPYVSACGEEHYCYVEIVCFAEDRADIAKGGR